MRTSQMNLADRYKITKWLEENWEDIIDRQLTRSVAAEEVCMSLEVVIDGKQLSDLAKSRLGKSWPVYGGQNTTKGDRLKRLVCYLDVMVSVIDNLEKDLAEDLWGGQRPNREVLDNMKIGKPWTQLAPFKGKDEN